MHSGFSTEQHSAQDLQGPGGAESRAIKLRRGVNQVPKTVLRPMRGDEFFRSAVFAFMANEGPIAAVVQYLQVRIETLIALSKDNNMLQW
jgi:hypothetical protein